MISTVFMQVQKPAVSVDRKWQLTHSGVRLGNTTTHTTEKTSHGRARVERLARVLFNLCRSEDEDRALGGRLNPGLNQSARAGLMNGD